MQDPPEQAQPSGYVRPMRNGVRRPAHVWAWVDAFGEPPADRPCVLHHCDVRNCWEITHLFVGTLKDNYDDMVAKGRDLRSLGKDWQKAKQRCPKGHPLAGENLIPNRLARGGRVCRWCKNEQERDRRAAIRRAKGCRTYRPRQRETEPF